MQSKRWFQAFVISIVFTMPNVSQAFCGFYMARADSQLYNKSSKVVMARKDETTVITMVNDYQGEEKDFAMLVPVPQVLKRNQIRIARQEVVERVDAFSAPRLVKYYDNPQCNYSSPSNTEGLGARSAQLDPGESGSNKAYGVKIEASYSVGEYDILILSAQQSRGLLQWLKSNNYKVDSSATKVLESYIKQDMRFFVAKVNLAKKRQQGLSYLRPLQIRFDSKKFMLPIRLGMANAQGTQELYVFTLTAKGRVETTNYRTVKPPTDIDLPLYIEKEFGGFYQALFDRQFEQYDKRAVFLEYAGNVNRCDPCSSNPLSRKELRELGVFWLKPEKSKQNQAIIITRLHLRYDQEHFPDDLVFQETNHNSYDRFQLRYIVREPTTNGLDCEDGFAYVNHELPLRYETEADNLSELTGEDVNIIRKRLNLPQHPPGQKSFWQFIQQSTGR